MKTPNRPDPSVWLAWCAAQAGPVVARLGWSGGAACLLAAAAGVWGASGDWRCALALCVGACLGALGAVSGWLAERRRVARAHQDALQRMALTDSLTGLANRAAFIAELDLRCTRVDAPFALLFIDLDRFKVLNDTLGHLAADTLLVDIGKVIRASVPADAFVARPGGDEFAIIVPLADGAAHLKTLVQQLLARVATPFDLQGRRTSVSASAGIALFPEHGAAAARLLSNADVAMYASKEAGRNTFMFFGHALSAAIGHFELERELQGALAAREFVLHYQPLFDPLTGHLEGVEALIRWPHADKGLISPGVFVPLLERTGLIVEVGAWVIDEALRQLRAWNDAGATGLTMSVNVSARQLQGNALTGWIGQALRRHGIAAERVQVELTETDLMANPVEAQRILAALQTMGIRIAIDDFGTGHSSLSYLTRFAPDVLKIDKSFIDDIDLDVAARTVVEGIIDLAHRLGLGVVAEGVERTGQLAVLRDAQCDEVQGFLLGRPTAADAALALILANHRAALPAPAPGRTSSIAAMPVPAGAVPGDPTGAHTLAWRR